MGFVPFILLLTSPLALRVGGGFPAYPIHTRCADVVRVLVSHLSPSFMIPGLVVALVTTRLYHRYTRRTARHRIDLYMYDVALDACATV